MGVTIVKPTSFRSVLHASAMLVFLTILAFFGLSSRSARANSSASASIFVPAAYCNVSTDSVNDTPHIATINNGTYKEDIGTTTFSVFCGDTGGFSVYAIGYSNNEFGNTKLLANVGGSLSPANDIVTGTGISDTDTGGVSNWAMKAVPVSGAYAPTIENGFNNYSLVPSTYTKIATFNSTTTETIGSSFYTTYRAYISRSQPAGTYSGKVRYTLVHPASNIPDEPKDCGSNKICYWPNAGNTVVDSMGDQSASANSEVTLWASNFKREGYGFAGWSDKYDWELNQNDENGNGTGSNAGYHIYGPNQTITTPSDLVTNGLSLYAVWVKSTGNLQGWTGCSTMSVGEITALTDIRDNDTYAIAKLKDDNCWMVENLRLDNDAVGNSDGSLAQGYASNFIGLAGPETATFGRNSTTPNSLYSTDGSNGTFAITGFDQAYRFPRYNNINTSSTTANMTQSDNDIYSYGNYYTFAAAVANTDAYNGNVSTSICSSGWHLPTGNSGGEFYNMGVAVNASVNTDIKLRDYPNNFVWSGIYSSAGSGNKGRYGEFLSSTVYYQTEAYLLFLTEGASAYLGIRRGDTCVGRSIRCIAD